jgi:hypothetical protein
LQSPSFFGYLWVGKPLLSTTKEEKESGGAGNFLSCQQWGEGSSLFFFLLCKSVTKPVAVTAMHLTLELVVLNSRFFAKIYIENHFFKLYYFVFSRFLSNIITINVPLFKKLRDIIFFCGTITL